MERLGLNGPCGGGKFLTLLQSGQTHLPTAAERAWHELTHFLPASWCRSCVEGTGIDDTPQDTQGKERRVRCTVAMRIRRPAVDLSLGVAAWQSHCRAKAGQVRGKGA